MDLCKNRIVGRFSPFEEASVKAVKGGDYELIGGRVKWGCHGVIAWLTQANTSVRQRCIHYFSVLIIKTYMYYVFNAYMYYKRNTGGLWLRLSLALSGEGFRPAHDILKEIDPHTDFYTCDLYTVFLLILFCYIIGFRLLVTPN